MGPERSSYHSSYMSRVRKGINTLKTGFRVGLAAAKLTRLGVKMPAIKMSGLPHSNNWVLTSGWIIRTCEIKGKTDVAIMDRFWPNVDLLSLSEAIKIGRDVKDLAHMFVVSEQAKENGQWVAHIDLQRLQNTLNKDIYLISKEKIAEVFKGTDGPVHAPSKNEAEGKARANVFGNLTTFLTDFFDKKYQSLRYYIN